MKLDNEQQKALLLQIVSTTGVNGSYGQAKEAVIVIDGLIESIQNAEVSSNEGSN